MVTRQLQVERRTGKVRRPKTDVLLLCHRHPTAAYYSSIGPWRDERLSWPGCLTYSYSGWFTHINGHPSAIGQAQDRGSSPAKDRRSAAVPKNQLRTVPFQSDPWHHTAHLVYRAVFNLLVVCERQHEHVRYRLAVTQQKHAANTPPITTGRRILTTVIIIIIIIIVIYLLTYAVT